MAEKDFLEEHLYLTDQADKVLAIFKQMEKGDWEAQTRLVIDGIETHPPVPIAQHCKKLQKKYGGTLQQVRAAREFLGVFRSLEDFLNRYQANPTSAFNKSATRKLGKFPQQLLDGGYITEDELRDSYRSRFPAS